ncbi:hypothetical protein KAX17_12230 [Candidatus Bipolaricaulota bacterium]|nr:hypothetical protein [Candidatus Bipolaricaulota bacterium]
MEYPRSLQGRLRKIPFEVCVIVSKQHHRDKRPVYFLSTHLSLDVRTILTWYGRRWPCEVNHLYLKVRLDVGDFRVRLVGAVEKYVAGGSSWHWLTCNTGRLRPS